MGIPGKRILDVRNGLFIQCKEDRDIGLDKLIVAVRQADLMQQQLEAKFMRA